MTFVPELWTLRGSPNDPPLRKSERSMRRRVVGNPVVIQLDGLPPNR